MNFHSPWTKISIRALPFKMTPGVSGSATETQTLFTSHWYTPTIHKAASAMYWQILSCVVALLGLAHAQHPGVTAPPGPQPTPFRGRYAKRQDNVKKNIEIHRAYAAPIGVDTQYLTMEGSSTKVSYSGTSQTLISQPLRSFHRTRLTGLMPVDRR